MLDHTKLIPAVLPHRVPAPTQSMSISFESAIVDNPVVLTSFLEFFRVSDIARLHIGGVFVREQLASFCTSFARIQEACIDDINNRNAWHLNYPHARYPFDSDSDPFDDISFGHSRHFDIDSTDSSDPDIPSKALRRAWSDF